ncbi:MAG TPA: hypothetical protein VGO59_19885 [Verrucomicrobiae bacterium]
MACAFFLILLLPLKIISYGYLPPDDALADSAKAISGKPWQDILLLKSDYAIDNHIGWHTFLRQVYFLTKCDADGLALISTVGLFTLAAWAALPWVKRPEAWIATLILAIGVQASFMGRFMLGRPLMLSMLALMTILFLQNARSDAPPGKFSCALMTVCMALAIMLHGVWYFWALPVAAFFLAGQYRWCAALAVCWVAGTILGSLGTGHPMVYVVEAWRQAVSVIGAHSSQGTLVGELQATTSNWFPLALMGGLLILRQLARLPAPPMRSQPAFWLACIGWVLGYRAERFWDDWGMPALMALMALDLDLLLQKRQPARALGRLALMGGLALTLFLTTTNDAGSRWSSSASWEYLKMDDSSLAGWLPEPGGIFYETDMEFFFHTFFKNPTAPWRYSVGYESALMPKEDFDTYQQILLHFEEPEAYQPWIKKMRPADRLVLSSHSSPAAFLPSLEWKHGVGNLWLGRLPRKGK